MELRPTVHGSREEPATASGPERRTRDAVLRRVLEHGPQTAAELARTLDLTTAAIRRHLDALVSSGVLSESDRRPVHAGPGRPARAYALTDAGRASLPHGYDDLASSALDYLRSTGGEQAVQAFAEHRAQLFAQALRDDLARPGRAASDPLERARTTAGALTRHGYASTVEPVGNGVQICQHHCPVADVATRFPQLCEAETRALESVLGTYVQRLATIAHGDGVCTTHIPSAIPAGTRTVGRPETRQHDISTTLRRH